MGSDTINVNEWFFLKFLLEMKIKAKESRSRKRKIMYKDREHKTALEFLAWVETNGGTVEDAAELMSMHKSTLQGWLDDYPSLEAAN